MKQSRQTSLLKSLVSTFAGLGLALFLQWLVLPMLLHVEVPLDANLKFAALMTVVSIVRGYLLERFFEWMGWRVKLSPFMDAVLFECFRQRNEEGWSIEHDDEHTKGVLAQAGAAYALGDAAIHCERWEDGKTVKVTGRLIWPWEIDWWKPRDFRDNQIRAAALIIAEGDKFDRSRKQKRRSF